MHIAAENNNVQIVKLLLKNKDIDVFINNEINCLIICDLKYKFYGF